MTLVLNFSISGMRLRAKRNIIYYDSTVSERSIDTSSESAASIVDTVILPDTENSISEDDNVPEFDDIVGNIDPPPKRMFSVADDDVEFSVIGHDNTCYEDESEIQTESREPISPKPKKTPKPAPIRFDDIHPELQNVWCELKDQKLIKPHTISQPKQVLLTLLPFQLEGLYWLQKQEESLYRGGIMADEMGMGKTIQMLSLIATRRLDKPTLVVCPTVAIMQWEREILTRLAPNTATYIIFHGAERTASIDELLKVNVVITTYSILEHAFRRQNYGFKRKGVLVKEPSLLHRIHWGRVMLDEAHSIKDRTTNQARAVFMLERDYQWSITGTPLQNRVGDLFSLIRFMKLDPFSYYYCRSCPCKSDTWKFSDRRYCDDCGHITHRHFLYWNHEILKPIQNYGYEGTGLTSFKRLGLILDRVMLRRTKIDKTEEMGLPPRVIKVRRDFFNAAEEELYESLYSDSVRTFNTYVEANTVLNNYASIFSLLSRMRLAANHPDLVVKKLALETNTGSQNLVCGICNEQAEDPITSKCRHVFCREDARQYVQSFVHNDKELACPVCHQSLQLDLTQEQPEVENDGKLAKSIINYLDLTTWRSSTKIEALVEELDKLRNKDQQHKSLVFSQFVAFLDLVQWRLSRAGFVVARLDGRMGPTQRQVVIDKFMTDPECTVFLVSLKAGGVALNLTEASNVFILDPWWLSNLN
jgi:DNA repair protein RAD16